MKRMSKRQRELPTSTRRRSKRHIQEVVSAADNGEFVDTIDGLFRMLQNHTLRRETRREVYYQTTCLLLERMRRKSNLRVGNRDSNAPKTGIHILKEVLDYLNQAEKLQHWFPWGNGLKVDEKFWQSLVARDATSKGFLTFLILELWVQLMWCFRPKFDESLSEAWNINGMLRSCPHHGFSELTQVDTFYNGLTENEQDSLNAAAGGNLLSKTTREALNIIENKSKVRYSRNKTNASKVNSRENISKTDERIDKLADQLSTLVEIVSKKVVTPAPVKAVEENCVTCGGAHAWYNCPATDNNQNVCATTGTYNQQAPPNRVSNQMAPPGFAPVQNRNYNNQGQGNNFNRGNNFQNQGFQGQVNHASNFQNQGFQNQPFQMPNNQVNDFSNDFSNYKKSNDQTIRNLQYQITYS
ncbi:hypothetical protein Tco_1525820 [Tanacetum coccineum]